MKFVRILVAGTFLAGTALMVGAPKAEAASSARRLAQIPIAA